MPTLDTFGSKMVSVYSTVDRLDYSSDTATASSKGPLTSPIDMVSATGNSSFGYYAGGPPSGQTTIDRIDYSNDTATASPKGIRKRTIECC